MKPKEKVMEIYEARALPSEEVVLHDAENRVSAAMISLYPPGIPVVVPGERIDRETISYLEDAMKMGLTVNGLGNYGKNLKVC
jgi:arginine/lysine/ornithine decarboxylase